MTSNIMIEDQESWLYADDTEHVLKNQEVPCTNISDKKWLEVAQPTSNNDQRSGLESDQEHFEEDSDDDGIIVSIGINDVGSTFTRDTHNIKINGGLLADKVVKSQSVPQLGKFLVDDFTQPGNIDGTPVGEFKIEDIDEKPWRQPGADLSDYFNYSFNENTWIAYCERQKRVTLNESKSDHLLLTTSHCVTPVINGYSNISVEINGDEKQNSNPAINTDRPKSHSSRVLPDMSMPPPVFKLAEFKSEHAFNSGHKPSQENLSYRSPGQSNPRSSSSSRSNFDTRSTQPLQVEKRKFRKNDFEVRDLNKRRERSREKHNKSYERREKSRSRSRRRRSRSRDRYYESKRSRRDYH